MNTTIKTFKLGDKKFITNVVTNDKSIGKSLMDGSNLKIGTIDGIKKMIPVRHKKDYFKEYLKN